MFNKILSINKNMVSSGRKDAAFNPGEESTLRSLREALEGSKAIPQGSLDLVIRVVTQWPYSDRLPGLDLLRCMVKSPAVAQFSEPQHGSILDLVIAASVSNDSTPNENAAMMGARTIANLFGSVDGRSLIISQADKALSFLERVVGIKGGDAIGKFNRNVLIAVTTSAVNLSVLVNKEKLLTPEQRRRLLVLLGAILEEQSDSEVLYRALVALGTILSTSQAEAKDLGVSSWIQQAAGNSSEDRVLSIISECKKLASR